MYVTETDEREILSYELFGVAARELAQTIADDGFRPDAIVGIARGGLTRPGRSATHSTSRCSAR